MIASASMFDLVSEWSFDPFEHGEVLVWENGFVPSPDDESPYLDNPKEGPC